ncbi:reticulocyte-binding protein homolog 1 [Eupeodes corollae]|uniref:reticulocyte-binding protein homolog 1 n=1 Tax=Eupeodes corollae TaxID=290404 RepID=UPI0024911412|nr:reticulocyte-binding protein homolog 1 [Eupeodes corollae]
MSKKVSIRYLINVAIGSPEPGVVNFNALYTVLQAISEKLDIEDDQIEVDSSLIPVTTNILDSKSNVSSEQLMNRQVYDNSQDEQLASKNRSENSTETKRTQVQPSSSTHNQQIIEDRKVVFGNQHKKTHDNEDASKNEGKKSKDLDIRQQIDFLCEKLEKIENFAAWSFDTEQSVEYLRQVVDQLQDKVELLDRSICEIKNIRYDREKDISACRGKLDYDKLLHVTEVLRQDLNALKESIYGSDSKKLQMKNTLSDSPNDLEIERLDNELIELKSNNCIFNEKLKSLEETVANIDIDSSIAKLDLFHNEISTLKAQIENSTIETEQQALKEFTNKLAEEVHLKIDKAEIEELLSEKVDYSMLHGKVSVEVMDAENRKFEKQLTEITDCVIFNDERIQKQIEDIKKLVGDENLNDLLNKIEHKLNKEIQRISSDLKRLMEMKPDIDSAVTRLKDLTCLACDQDVVMKTVEVNNLTKFGDAHVSKSIGPSVSFEVAKLRASGKIGAFNDDDIIFHLEKKFRHSGGVHTIITRKDYFTKTKQRRTK